MHWKDLVESFRTPPRVNSPDGAGLSRPRASQVLLPTSGDASPQRAEVGLPTDKAAQEHRKASRAATPNLFGHTATGGRQLIGPRNLTFPKLKFLLGSGPLYFKNTPK